MLTPGPAKKVVIHLNEDESSETGFIYQQVLRFLLEQGVSGATLLKPEAGFGSHHRLHEKEWYGGDKQHLPVRVEFVESAERVNAVLPGLCTIVQDGLIEAQDTMVIKVARQESSF
jgi:uncharacterized protein